MSVLATLDATRICARWSSTAPDAWARPVPVPERVERTPATDGYRWRTLLRNPQALAVTGVVATLVAVESAARRLAPR